MTARTVALWAAGVAFAMTLIIVVDQVGDRPFGEDRRLVEVNERVRQMFGTDDPSEL